MREFITIAESVQSEITEKKSKFIASLFYVENSEEAEKIIKEIKSELQKKFGVSSEKIISCKPLYIKEFYA